MATNLYENRKWIAVGDEFYQNPLVKGIVTELYDREGQLDLLALMNQASKDYNRIYLKADDPDYDFLRINVVGLSKKYRRPKFKALIDYCLEYKLIELREDKVGKYFYFHIIDSLDKVYINRMWKMSRQAMVDNSGFAVEKSVDKQTEIGVISEKSRETSEKSQRYLGENSGNLGENSRNLGESSEISQSIMYPPTANTLQSKDASHDAEQIGGRVEKSRVEKSRVEVEEKRIDNYIDLVGAVETVDKSATTTTTTTFYHKPIPLKSGEYWTCPKDVFERWQDTFIMLNIEARLTYYAEYFTDHPDKQNYPNQIVKSLEFFLIEDEKRERALKPTVYGEKLTEREKAKEKALLKEQVPKILCQWDATWTHLRENEHDIFEAFINTVDKTEINNFGTFTTRIIYSVTGKEIFVSNQNSLHLLTDTTQCEYLRGLITRRPDMVFALFKTLLDSTVKDVRNLDPDYEIYHDTQAALTPSICKMG